MFLQPFTTQHTFARQRPTFSSDGKKRKFTSPLFQHRSRGTRQESILRISVFHPLTHWSWAMVHSGLQQSVSSQGNWYFNCCHHTSLDSGAFWDIHSHNFCLVQITWSVLRPETWFKQSMHQYASVMSVSWVSSTQVFFCQYYKECRG